MPKENGLICEKKEKTKEIIFEIRNFILIYRHSYLELKLDI